MKTRSYGEKSTLTRTTGVVQAPQRPPHGEDDFMVTGNALLGSDTTVTFDGKEDLHVLSLPRPASGAVVLVARARVQVSGNGELVGESCEVTASRGSVTRFSWMGDRWEREDNASFTKLERGAAHALVRVRGESLVASVTRNGQKVGHS